MEAKEKPPLVTLKTAVLLGEREEKAAGKESRPWKHDAFEIVLECDGRTLETPWKQGVGNRVPPMGADKNQHKRPDGKWWTCNGPVAGKPKTPKADDVLSSLLMDTSGTSETFEDWCAEFGDDSDSRKALAMYLHLQELAKDLRIFLGMSAEVAVEKYGDGDAEEAARVLCGGAPVVKS